MKSDTTQVMTRQSILFVCTHNSARSQIGEGLVNHYLSTNYTAYSAGTEETRVNPLAIEVMEELGIDITHHQSKVIDIFMDRRFDYVITVCDNAKETCPYFPNADTILHKSFSDPSSVVGNRELKLKQFRLTRDKMKSWLLSKFGN